jgi:hypothetical protein
MTRVSTNGQCPDPAPIRIAVEHLTGCQGQPLDLAAALIGIFVVGLVHDRMGEQAARRVLNTVAYHLDRRVRETTPTH